MKAGKEHRTPLPRQAVALISSLLRLVVNKLVFSATRGKQFSDMSLTGVLKRMERPALTRHSFRSTFRDWAGETTACPREIIAHALAHGLKNPAEAVCRRGDLLVAKLMADRATFCDATAASDK